MSVSTDDGTINEVLSRIREVGIDLDRLECIYVIDGILINEEPLRIGKGRGELGEVDLPVIKLPSGDPYIPGSSIKGVLRSLAESLVRSVYGAQFKVCEPSVGDVRFARCSLAAELLTRIYYDTVSRRFKFLRNESEVTKVVRKYLGSEEEARSLVNTILNRCRRDGLNEAVNTVINELGPCVICQIFGNTAVASHIEVLDAVPRISGVPLLSRTRVAIDRFRGASRSSALFNYEFVPRGVEWRFKLVIRNIDLSRDTLKSKLIKSLLRALASDEYSIELGSMKSVGLGWVRLDKERTRVTKYVVKDFSIEKDTETRLSEVIEL